MKKFLVINFLVCIGLVAAIKTAVDSAFVVHTNEIRISEIILPSVDPELILDDEQLSELDFQIDQFSPSSNIVAETENTPQVDFAKVAKKQIHLNETALKTASHTKEIEKGSIEQIELELSYSEVSEPKLESLNKIKQIAWSEQFNEVGIEIEMESRAIAFDSSQINDVVKLEQAAVKETKTEQVKVEKKLQVAQIQENKKEDISLEEEQKSNEEIVYYDYAEKANIKNESDLDAVIEERIQNFQLEKERIEQDALKKQKTITHGSKIIEEEIIEQVVSTEQAKQIDFKKSKKRNNKERSSEERIQKSGEGNSNGFIGTEEPEVKDQVCFEENGTSNKIYSGSTRIKFQSINYQNLYSDVYDYELRMEDDIDESYNADEKGAVILKYDLNTQFASRRITVFHKDHIPLKTELRLSEGKNNISLPLIDNYTLRDIVQDHRITRDSHLLLELSGLVEDAELDANIAFDHKLFINDKFEVVDRSYSDYSYILFLGVEAGNGILNIKDSHNNIVSKIVHVSENAVLFEATDIDTISRAKVAFFEEAPLSKCKAMINIEKDDLASFSSEPKMSKNSLNTIGMFGEKVFKNTRNYYELKHLTESIFVGKSRTNKNIIIPSEDYIQEVLAQFSFANASNSCLVQVNLTKSAKEFYVNGIAERGMRLDAKILDTDGLFYEELGENSNRIFFSGDTQGILNIKIKYVDGSSDYLQTYCSNATYLVEQL